jgi:hypothetical protein
MNRRYLGIGAMACSLLLSGVRAAEKPNFSGTWRLNLSKSKLSDGSPVPYYNEFIHEIDHHEPKFRLTERIKPAEGEPRVVEWNLTTDGKEYDTKVADKPSKISGMWDGDRLVTRIVYQESGVEYQVVRKSVLSEDGKTVTAEWEVTTPGGSQRATEIWEKQ